MRRELALVCAQESVVDRPLRTSGQAEGGPYFRNIKQTEGKKGLGLMGVGVDGIEGA